MPDGLVVDTDVLSYLFRRDTRAELYRPYLTDAYLMISFMTIAELEQWTIRRGWGPARQERLALFLERFSIILVDLPLCRTWAEVGEQARRTGRPIQAADAWIAATALTLRLPLLTNNRDDFMGVEGLTLLPNGTS
jgi:predicted nucleic acid-binding protein